MIISDQLEIENRARTTSLEELLNVLITLLLTSGSVSSIFLNDEKSSKNSIDLIKATCPEPGGISDVLKAIITGCPLDKLSTINLIAAPLLSLGIPSLK